jgi:histidinol-phosphate aminotransferase
MIEKLVRLELKGFEAYNPNQLPYRVKLDANESPFDLPEAVKKKLIAFLSGDSQVNLYPDTNSTELRKTLSAYWKVDVDGIVVGTGSDQLIQVLINVFVGKGDRVICPVPSFSMYSLNTIVAGGIPVELPLLPEENYRYRPDEVIRKAGEEKAKLIFLCTPNNPTGDTIPLEDIVHIAEGCPDSIIAIDEAYAEFSGETAVSLVERYENVILLRTFSKAYGLAGVRCGYSLSSKALANEINKVRPPYNISSLSQYTAQLVFEEREEVSRKIESIIRERESLANILKEMKGVMVYPSRSNFLLVKIGNSRRVYEELVKRGVLVRSFGSMPRLEDCLRISVGSREQNAVLLQELQDILSQSN